MSFQNRMIIPSANGLTTLSIPLRGGRENRELLRNVRIDNTQRWQVRHWRTIISAYRRSPWFEFYEPGLLDIYEAEYEFLYQWNLDILRWILAQLKAEVEWHIGWDKTNISPDPPGPYLKPANFRDAVFCNDLPPYAQVFQDRLGFQPNVSIADLIFNEGNKSRSLLL